MSSSRFAASIFASSLVSGSLTGLAAYGIPIFVGAGNAVYWPAFVVIYVALGLISGLIAGTVAALVVVANAKRRSNFAVACGLGIGGSSFLALWAWVISGYSEAAAVLSSWLTVIAGLGVMLLLWVWAYKGITVQKSREVVLRGEPR